MKKILIIPVALLMLAVCSCKDKNVFTLSGTIAHPGSLKKIYLLESDSSQISIVDSTLLSEEGKFQFKHYGPYASLYRLRTGGSIFDLIAQNGEEIDFKTDLSDTSHTYTISGSPESAKMQEYNKLSNVYNAKLSQVSAAYEAASEALGHESDSLRNVFMPRFMVLLGKQSDAALKFAKENKTSLAGFYAVITTLDPEKYEAQLVSYADDIKDNFKDNPGVQKFIAQMAKLKPLSIGHPAPDFTTGGIDGKPVKLSDFKGKYVMVDFWASWCAPCRAENPNVVKHYALYHPKGFNILGVSLDVDKDAWQKAITADKLTWQHASDLQRFDGPTEKLYHIEAIPSNFIIDSQGIIVAKNLRGADFEEFLNKTFSKPQ